MGFIRFFIRIITGIVFAFCWSFIGVLAGINDHGSPFYSVYGWGIMIFFVLGLWVGGRLALWMLPKGARVRSEENIETDIEATEKTNKEIR